ncbi:TPA: hypothetical protein ACOEOC_004585, partial [Stenotrophomonas maltophilia]
LWHTRYKQHPLHHSLSVPGCDADHLAQLRAAPFGNENGAIRHVCPEADLAIGPAVRDHNCTSQMDF